MGFLRWLPRMGRPRSQGCCGGLGFERLRFSDRGGARGGREKITQRRGGRGDARRNRTVEGFDVQASWGAAGCAPTRAGGMNPPLQWVYCGAVEGGYFEPALRM